MNRLSHPRPIEFIKRGFSVSEMEDILSHWDEATEADLKRIGFIAVREQFVFPEAPEQFERGRGCSPVRLQVVQGGRQSDLGNRQCTQALPSDAEYQDY